MMMIMMMTKVMIVIIMLISNTNTRTLFIWLTRYVKGTTRFDKSIYAHWPTVNRSFNYMSMKDSSIQEHFLQAEWSLGLFLCLILPRGRRCKRQKKSQQVWLVFSVESFKQSLPTFVEKHTKTHQSPALCLLT